MAIAFPDAVQNAMLNAITTYAGTGALLKIYSGTQPATGGAVDDGTYKLAQLTFSGALSAGASAGVLTLNLPASDTSADKTGTASWARITKSDGTTVVCDMNVTATGGNGTLELDTTSIQGGGTVAITSASITAGND